jgi:hypothetical protein
LIDVVRRTVRINPLVVSVALMQQNFKVILWEL